MLSKLTLLSTQKLINEKPKEEEKKEEKKEEKVKQ